MSVTGALDGQVGLFFWAKGFLLLHTCPLQQAEVYGGFRNYPHSHDWVWRKYYQARLGVDFDYYPRGRLIYDMARDEYLLYYDRCMEQEAKKLAQRYQHSACRLCLDEHYSCAFCRADYADIRE